MKIIGIIDFIGQKTQKTETFFTREIWITTQGQHPQTINVQFTNDKCELLNNFQVGQFVEIDTNVLGRKHQNSTTGIWTCFNTIQGWRIVTPQQQGYTNTGYHGQGSAVNAFMNQGQQPPQNFNQNSGYGGNQNYGQQHPSGFPPSHNAPQGYNQQQPQNFNQSHNNGFQQNPNFGNQEEPDDLPF